MPVSQLGVLKLDGSQKGVFNSAQIGKGLFQFPGPQRRMGLKTGHSVTLGLPNAGEARDKQGFDPWSARSPGVGNGTPLQYSCLENSLGRGAWRATVRGAAKSWA